MNDFNIQPGDLVKTNGLRKYKYGTALIERVASNIFRYLGDKKYFDNLFVIDVAYGDEQNTMGSHIYLTNQVYAQVLAIENKSYKIIWVDAISLIKIA